MSSRYEDFGPVLWGKRLRFLDKRGAASLAEVRRRRGSSGNSVTDGEKEFICAGWRAEAEQPGGAVGGVAEGVGRIGRNVRRFAGLH